MGRLLNGALVTAFVIGVPSLFIGADELERFWIEKEQRETEFVKYVEPALIKYARSQDGDDSNLTGEEMTSFMREYNQETGNEVGFFKTLSGPDRLYFPNYDRFSQLEGARDFLTERGLLHKLEKE